MAVNHRSSPPQSCPCFHSKFPYFPAFRTYSKAAFIRAYLIMAQLLCLAKRMNVDRCFLSVSYNQLCHVTNHLKHSDLNQHLFAISLKSESAEWFCPSEPGVADLSRACSCIGVPWINFQSSRISSARLVPHALPSSKRHVWACSHSVAGIQKKKGTHTSTS